MNRRWPGLLSMLLLTLLASTPALGGTLTGSTDGGAFYRIEVPAAWNGDLVIWNHGLSLAPVGPLGPGDLGPLAPLQLAEGYAVAASSYQQSGWAVFKTKNDLQNLLEVFKANFGQPDQVFVTGGSLGGIVTAAALEEAHLGNVVGAYSVCGALAGSRNWDEAVDLRLVYDTVCSSVPGAFIPGGAEGLPDGLPFTTTQMALAVNECTGILLPSSLRSPAQAANLDQILSTTRLPESFLLTDMVFATFGLSDLVHGQDKLNGQVGTGNAEVDYDDAFINASVERVSPNPGAANRLGRHYTPTGDVGDVKIVSIHTDKDGLAVVENESSYASVVPVSNLTTGIVVEAAPTHCGFTGAEVAAGWEALRGWTAGAPQPTASDLQAACAALAPVFGGPCRIDPGFVIPDINDRIRPR